MTSRVCLILKLSVSSSLELEETIFVWSMSVWCLRYTVLHRNLCTYLVPFLVHQGFSEQRVDGTKDTVITRV